MRSLCRELELNLINLLNSYDLPIEAKYYVLKGVYQNTQQVFEDFLNAEEVVPQPQEEEPMPIDSAEAQVEVTQDGDDIEFNISSDNPAAAMAKAIEVVAKGQKKTE